MYHVQLVLVVCAKKESKGNHIIFPSIEHQILYDPMAWEVTVSSSQEIPCYGTW
jgi:cysteine sulfinate desulfinase/cysteine desulfurase-like protein